MGGENRVEVGGEKRVEVGGENHVEVGGAALCCWLTCVFDCGESESS